MYTRPGKIFFIVSKAHMLYLANFQLTFDLIVQEKKKKRAIKIRICQEKSATSVKNKK